MSGQEQASVNIPKDLLEPIIREHIAAGVVAAIGDPATLIRQLVEKAASAKVDMNGEVSRYCSDNKYSFIEAVATRTLHESIKAAIVEYVKEQRPAIQAAVKSHLAKRTSAVAKALVDGLIASTEQRWDLKCEFIANRNER